MQQHHPACTIGLALSGGTLKAAAHVGVIQALEELGINPTFVAGTSAGAFVAALYAHGYSAPELSQLVREFPWYHVVDYGFPISNSILNMLRYRVYMHRKHRSLHLPTGLMQGRQLSRYFKKTLGNRTASKTFFVTATDLHSGEPKTYGNHLPLLNSNDILPITELDACIAGSCALPGILTPVYLGEHLLIDGGLRHYVPVDILKKAGCTRIIAVNLHQFSANWIPETFVDILVRSFEILLKDTIDQDISGSEVMVIEPNLDKSSWFAVEQMEKSIERGRQIIHDNTHRIKQWLISQPEQTTAHIPVSSCHTETRLKVRIAGKLQHEKR